MNERRHPYNEDLPRARIVRNWKTRLFWLVPIAAALLAGWFIYSDMEKRGPTIHILFDNAQELQAGKSELKYRDAQIGMVKKIELTPDQQHVDITVSLERSAKNIAREGSRFWIVRAHLALEEIRAARTIVSGNYITVDPGNGKEQTRFTGLPQEPILEPPADLTVVLISEKLGSIKPRAPVFYRGVQVGEVRTCELGATSQTVRISLQIQKHYRPLVRLNSKFWNAGGINFSIGLRGADISAQSAETLISGGISFATPDTAEQQAYPGTTFRLYEKPEDAWLSWAPAIPLEQSAAPPLQTTNTSSR